ncbi:hypothetical protein RRG08_028020 [Elysia crispata]|uniref:Uncharacterized protein n=1 Tax=Elysia crispata TaxID=231223 RepID=A0AAE1ED08_9GAST|nr:hypothetical protein RRG08_028020 [Elysia crispata]
MNYVSFVDHWKLSSVIDVGSYAAGCSNRLAVVYFPSSERETEGGSSTSRPHQVTEGAQLTGASRPGIQVHCTTDWPGEDRERRPDLAFCTPGRQSLDSVSWPWLSSVLALKPLR